MCVRRGVGGRCSRERVARRSSAINMIGKVLHTVGAEVMATSRGAVTISIIVLACSIVARSIARACE